MASLNIRKKLILETIQKSISQVASLDPCKAQAVAITYLETAAMWIIGGDFDGRPAPSEEDAGVEEDVPYEYTDEAAGD